MRGNLVIEYYPSLETLKIQDALLNLNSLKICNNEQLKKIEIRQGREYHDCYIKSVIIESIFYNMNGTLYLPNLESFISGDGALFEAKSFVMSSNSININI